jgi:pseudaminic acid cytidylyltransferase
MRLAVIPARGGSKRIPKKNLKGFCGKPIISWSIEAAIESGCFDDVLVSTDDLEIHELAVSLGASVPFKRPPDLADDHTGTTDVVSHAINWQIKNNIHPTEVCCIYATAPFILPVDIRYGLDALLNSNADYAFSVTSFSYPIQRALRVTQDGRIAMLHPENFNIRSQDFEEIWHDAGQFYWGRTNAWLSSKIMFSSASVPVCIPRSRVQDIDTIEDWDRAELMFKSLQIKA